MTFSNQLTIKSLISHVEISVSDYKRSLQFYDRVLPFLGWKRLVCQKSHTAFTDGASKLVFCPTDPRFLENGYHRKRTGLHHLAFYASSKEMVDELCEKVLPSIGVECLYEKKPSGSPQYYAAFFEDPDRIKIEVVFAPGYCEPDHWTNKLVDDFDPWS